MVPYKALQVLGRVSTTRGDEGEVCKFLLWALKTRGEDVEHGHGVALSLGCEMNFLSNN